MTNDYKKIYLEESDELLHQMNQSLLVLEKDHTNKDALNSIFRAAHTLKSMSASMGYTKISDLSHKMEDLLSDIRDGSTEITKDIISVLFKSFDFLEKMVAFVQEDKSINIDIEQILSLLNSLVHQSMKFEEEMVTPEISLNAFEKKTLARVKKEKFNTYHLIIILAKTCILKSVRAFMIFRNLHEIGEVIKSFPSSREIEEERFNQTFSCVFITKSDCEQVKEKVLEVMEVQSCEIKDIPVEEAWEYEDVQRSIDKFDTSMIDVPTSGSVEHLKKIRSVRVDIEQLDKMMNLVEELAINKLRLFDIGNKFPDSELKSITEVFNRLTDDLQNEVMKARLVPVSQVFDRFPRLVRDLAMSQKKKVKFDVIGGDIELDRTILDEIGDPLIHLIRNSIDHGVELPEERKKIGKKEEARLMLSAIREKSHILIEVEDDGRGMDVDVISKKVIERELATEEELKNMTKEQILMFTTNPGFTTNEDVSEVSGRGVGLDVVKEKTESLGGSILLETKAGLGTKITMILPVTTAVVQALMVRVGHRVFALPISSVIEIILLNAASIKRIEDQETILHRDQVLPIIRLDKIFASKNSESNDSEKINVVIVEYGSSQIGIVVDALMNQQDIVIKQLTKDLKKIKGFAGATILGDGKVALVLDVASLI